MPRQRVTQSVRRMDNDAARLERIGLARAKTIARQMLIAAGRAWRMDRTPPALTLRKWWPLLTEEITAGMVAGHLMGLRRAEIDAAPALERAARVQLSAFDDLLTFLRGRQGLDPEQVASLSRVYGDVATQSVEKASTAANQIIRKAMTEVAEQDLHVNAGIARLRQAFAEAGISDTADYRLETLYRTQTNLAYSAGQMASHATQEIQEILWGYEYATAGDDRVRPEHAAMDGVRAPKDDPIWQKWTPPCGYNCRCRLIPIFNNESVAVATDASDVPNVEPDRGFGFDKASLFNAVASFTP